MPKNQNQKQKKQTGRPSLFSLAKAERICAAVANGEPVCEACKAEGISVHALSRWRQKNKEFRAAFACARECSMQVLEFKLEEYVKIDDSFAKNEGLDPEIRMRAAERAFSKIKHLQQTYLALKQARENADQNQQQNSMNVSPEQMREWAQKIAEANRKVEEQADGKGRLGES